MDFFFVAIIVALTVVMLFVVVACDRLAGGS